MRIAVLADGHRAAKHIAPFLRKGALQVAVPVSNNREAILMVSPLRGEKTRVGVGRDRVIQRKRVRLPSGDLEIKKPALRPVS